MKIDMFIPPRKYEAVYVASIDGVNIGTAGLYAVDWVRKCAEFCIALLKQWCGLGYGPILTNYGIKHGFNELGLVDIWLGVETDNPRAIHMYKECGFVEDNILRMIIRSKGE